ncbi:sulfotransferase [Ruegeria hyattellae]|uniref:sulfotransferase n=1 Tax=Ruegeria hyattellae TaxID=3233337 RepID=UPI00355B6B3C
MNDTAPQTNPRRFLIIGLPRSGTTYLMTLLNAHRDVLCAGEQFNPYAIIGAEAKSGEYSELVQRDADPRSHSDAFFDSHAELGHQCVGYKLMIGHNIRMLRYLPDLTDYKLIYVHRENKLAQIASLIKASQSKRWAQSRVDSHVAEKIDAGPFRISQKWHEFATFDFLFSQWFRTLPQEKWKLEYREMFEDGFEQRLCDFLGVGFDPKMESPLVKQGANSILERFQKPGPIRAYFRKLGRGKWLDKEI